MPEVSAPMTYSHPHLAVTPDVPPTLTCEVPRGPIVREICHPDGSVICFQSCYILFLRNMTSTVLNILWIV